MENNLPPKLFYKKKDLKIQRKGKFCSFGESVRTVLSTMSNTEGFFYGVLCVRWKEIIGEELSSLARPKQLKKIGTKNILILGASSSASMMVSYNQSAFKEKINEYFGENWIAEIKISHDSSF